MLGRLDELTAENEHFEFYWFPHTEGCLTKRNNRTTGPARPLPRWRYLLDDEFLSNTRVRGRPAGWAGTCPAAIPAVNAVAARALGARTYTDAAYRVFTSPRRVRFKEQEYAVPRAALADVLGEVRALFRRRDWRISFPIEVRVTPGDDVWLSTAYGRDSAYIAIHVPRQFPHQEYFGDVEAVMVSGGRAAALGQDAHPRPPTTWPRAYPRFADFVALRDAARPGAPVRQRLPGPGAGLNDGAFMTGTRRGGTTLAA